MQNLRNWLLNATNTSIFFARNTFCAQRLFLISQSLHELSYFRLDEHATAEILRTPLHQVALTIKLLRLGSVGDFLAKAIEQPPYDMIIESETMLQS